MAYHTNNTTIKVYDKVPRAETGEEWDWVDSIILPVVIAYSVLDSTIFRAVRALGIAYTHVFTGTKIEEPYSWRDI